MHSCHPVHSLLYFKLNPLKNEPEFNSKNLFPSHEMFNPPGGQKLWNWNFAWKWEFDNFVDNGLEAGWEEGGGLKKWGEALEPDPRADIAHNHDFFSCTKKIFNFWNSNFLKFEKIVKDETFFLPRCWCCSLSWYSSGSSRSPSSSQAGEISSKGAFLNLILWTTCVAKVPLLIAWLTLWCFETF